MARTPHKLWAVTQHPRRFRLIASGLTRTEAHLLRNGWRAKAQRNGWDVWFLITRPDEEPPWHYF